MFHERISLIWVVLLLLLEFVIGSKLELMYKSLITDIRSSQIYICLFQLLVLQSLFTEITCFVCTNRINLVCKCFVSKGFLKLPNFLVLIKQESMTSQTLALATFGELLSTEVNLLFLLHLMVLRYCLRRLRYLFTSSLSSLKLFNISATPKRIGWLYSSGGSEQLSA